MSALLSYLFGILTGAYLATQTAVLHMPTFHLPKTLAVDPVIVGFAVIVLLTIINAKSGKRGRK